MKYVNGCVLETTYKIVVNWLEYLKKLITNGRTNLTFWTLLKGLSLNARQETSQLYKRLERNNGKQVLGGWKGNITPSLL
jgi:hypothetical protein